MDIETVAQGIQWKEINLKYMKLRVFIPVEVDNDEACD